MLTAFYRKRFPVSHIRVSIVLRKCLSMSYLLRDWLLRIYINYLNCIPRTYMRTYMREQRCALDVAKWANTRLAAPWYKYEIAVHYSELINVTREAAVAQLDPNDFPQMLTINYRHPAITIIITRVNHSLIHDSPFDLRRALGEIHDCVSFSAHKVLIYSPSIAISDSYWH